MKRLSFVDRVMTRKSPVPMTTDHGEMQRGYDDGFSQPKYGDYLVTSNLVYSCVTLRSDLMSSVPLQLWKGKGDNAQEVTQGPAYDLLTTVNPFFTFNRLMYMSESSLGLWGEAYWLLEGGGAKGSNPKEIWWAKPTQMTVVRHKTDYIAGFVWTSEDGTERIFFEPHEVIWLRYPNPLDQFAGLPPVAAARLAADYESDALKAASDVHKNGMQLGGYIQPQDTMTTWTEAQARELERDLARRFTGKGKAHKWAVLRQQMSVNQLGVTPKDAQFIEGLNVSLETVARVYRVGVELLNGHGRTYENFNTALRALWELGLVPETNFIASELTEQLAPKLGLDAITFDLSGVRALQDDMEKKAAWVVSAVVNEVLSLEQASDLLGVEFDPKQTFRLPAGVTFGPLEDAEPEPVPPALAQEPVEMVMEQNAYRSVAFGGATHHAIYAPFDVRATKRENQMMAMVRGLLENLRLDVLTHIQDVVDLARSAHTRSVDPFDLEGWSVEFAREALPAITEIVTAEARAQLLDLEIEGAFDVASPQTIEFINGRVQRFATEVPKTTWNRLKESLDEGIANQEGIDALAERVTGVMAERIRSDARTIARTEVIGASNGGSLLAWRESGVVEGKAWLASLDNRCRPSHQEAHARYQSEPIPLGDDFEVGSGVGPAPGDLGSAEEDINCRCTMVPVLDTDILRKAKTDPLAPIMARLDQLSQPVVVSTPARTRRVERDTQGRLVAVVEE